MLTTVEQPGLVLYFFRLPMPILVLQAGTCFSCLFPTDQILSLDLLNFQALSFNANQIAFFIMFTHNGFEFVYYGKKAQTNSATFDSHSLVTELRAKL